MEDKRIYVQLIMCLDMERRYHIDHKRIGRMIVRHGVMIRRIIDRMTPEILENKIKRLERRTNG